MIWVPSENECPMSLSEIGALAAITVGPVGRGTEKLCRKKAGETIWVRGPYGRGFVIKGYSKLLVGGGTSIAPLMPLAEKLVESGRSVTLILAGQTADTIPLLPRARRLEKQGVELIYVTEDGSLGFKGVATDPLSNILRKQIRPDLHLRTRRDDKESLLYSESQQNSYSGKPRKIHKVLHKPLRLLRHRKIPYLQKWTRIRGEAADGYRGELVNE
jgi:hypothetical protein